MGAVQEKAGKLLCSIYLIKAPVVTGMGFRDDTERKIVTVLFQSVQGLRKRRQKEEQQR